MINILLPFLLMFLLLKTNARRKSLFCPTSIVLILYVVSFGASFLYVYLLGFKNVLDLENIFPSTFLSVSLLVFFFNFLKFDEFRLKTILLPSKRVIDITIFVTIVSSIISILYFFPIAIKGFLLNNIMEARNEIRNEGINPLIEESFLNTISSSIAVFYQLPIILLFISLILKYNKFVSLLLFISSLSYVFYVFAYLGRDGILFWMISFIGVYSFFYRFMKLDQRKLILRLFSLISLVGLFGFAIITLSRFGNTSNYEYGVLGGLIDYMGQTISNFSDIYNAKFTHMFGGYSFGFFRSLIGLEEIKIDLFISELAAQNVPSWVWGTLIRSFYIDFGMLGVIALGIFFNIIFGWFNNIHNTSYTMKLSSLMMYFLFFQIYSQGVFYFRQYTKGMNLNIILTILLSILFYYLIKSSKNRIIININIDNK